jgi:site-specific recombinase XerD
LLNIKQDEIDIVSGEVLIRRGKNGKPRTVFVGRKTRKAIRSYLKYIPEGSPALWINIVGEPLRYGGLKEVIIRRAKDAGIKAPTLHSFRRAFALTMLRAGVDIYALKKSDGS